MLLFLSEIFEPDATAGSVELELEIGTRGESDQTRISFRSRTFLARCQLKLPMKPIIRYLFECVTPFMGKCLQTLHHLSLAAVSEISLDRGERVGP